MCSHILKVVMYADDVTIFFSFETSKETYKAMITELTRVDKWIKLYRFSIYAKRTN